MNFREAHINDIAQIQFVRNAVKENTLSDPNLVPNTAVEDFLFNRGKGWVCEINNQIVGFSIIDLEENNVWALFVHPDFEQKGIGKKLHQLMLDWYFIQSATNLWLGTSAGTRAEKFYTLMGWKMIGKHGNDEIKFELTKEDWLNFKKKI